MRIRVLFTCLMTAFFALIASCVLIFTFATLFSVGFFDNKIEFVDELPPIITLNGAEKINTPAGVEFEDPGVDAYDLHSEISSVETIGKVDTTKAGTYTIEYVATDEPGNQASITREVNVVEPKGIIYLTFDDGPGPQTGKLLDVLAKYGVKATFFITNGGDDETILREYKEGHAVGIHTASHNYAYIYQSVENYLADFDAVQDRIKRVTGTAADLMRFPGGSSNLISRNYDHGQRIMSKLANILTERGFTYFDWNVDSRDAGGATTADEVYNNVVSTLKVGAESVVLQHDIKDYSVDAVERIIKYGLDNGFIFKKLDKTSFTSHHGINN